MNISVCTPVVPAVALALSYLTVGPTFASTAPFDAAYASSQNPNATGPGGLDTVAHFNSGPPTPATSNYSNSGPWGNVSAQASADLSTGILGASASASSLSSTLTSAAEADFGDGFTTTTTTGQPFTWGASGTATFNLTVDGSLTQSNPQDGFARIVLAILKPGTLTYTSGTPDYSASDILHAYYWSTTATSSFCLLVQGSACVPVQRTGLFPETTSGTTLTQTFTPGGDFDWFVSFAALGIAAAGTSFNANYSDTLAVNYIAPAGTVTTSASGGFKNITTASAPEPATIALLGWGLLGLGLSGRRRARRS